MRLFSSPRSPRGSSPRASWAAAALVLVAHVGVVGVVGPVETAAAQPLRRALPAGELSGLELGIEGPMTVTPGTRARWLVVAHEVVRDRDLRPARDARIEAFTSYEPARPVAETRTDAYGRAIVDVAIPAELPSGFELQIDLRSERARLTRRFRVQVAVDATDRLTLVPMRPTPRPGERVAILGTLTDPLGGPRAHATVVLQAWRGNAPEGERRELTTDARGRFVAFVRAVEGPLRIDAEVTRDRRTVTARTAIVGTPVVSPSLVLRAVARTPVVAPSAVVEVDVQARDPRGLPLEGAEVRGPALDPDGPEERATTDARGVATLRTRAPAPEGDHSVAFSVVVPGLARSAVSSTIRVTRGRPVVRALVEGGALLAGLPSRVFARAVGADGRVLAETPLTLRLGEQALSATTDAAGVAVLEVSTPMPNDELGEPDGCGGGTAIEASATIAGTENRLCLPIDPDAVVRVRAEPREGELEVAVRRREDVARAPVAIVILASRPQGLVPVHATVLAAGTSAARFPSPNEPWVVRARALVTETHVEVRGSTVLLEPGAIVDVRIENDTVVADRSVLAVALPEDEAVVEPLPRSPAFVAARLAEYAPFDDAAPAVWRRGQVVFLAPPEEPVTRGVLRDPWRQRAVYRTGRLALVLRALEAEVANASAEGDLADVAHRVGGRWQLNRALLERAISGQPLGAEGARDLGGLPLSLDQLEAADRAIDFDHLAARVTRARLLRVLVALRELVQERGLDLVFARRGDVSTWLLALVDEGRIETSDLRDGWGGAIALRPSARPRFALFTPVAGYELLAPGPDGVLGSRDDLWDPLGRVLPSGLYSDAVDEEGLLLRLRGVSLAHATLAELGAIYEAVDSGAGEAATPLAQWTDVPSPLTIPPIDPRPFAVRPHAELVSPGTSLARLALGDRPGRYVVVLYDDAGEPVARAPHVRGGAATFVGQLPRRLPREPLRLRLPFVAFTALDGLRAELEVEGAEVRVLSSPEALTPGTLGILDAEVRASGDGVLAVRLVDASGREHARAGGRFTLATENATRDRRAAAVVRSGALWRLSTEIPDDALDVRAELVALAPRRWHRDPTFVEATRARPALGAWAEVLGGGAPDERTWQVLASTPGDAIDRACASIVAAALDAPELSRTTPEITGDLRVDAAMLAALAPAAPPPWRVGDDVFERLRRALRDASVTHADDLPVLARAAAALLLADARDESGRAILARALEVLESPPEDPPAVAGDPERDALATNAALALALHRADRPERAREILARDARRVWRLFEAPDEATFWWIAASAYGVAGQDASLEGASFDADGVARIALPAGAEEARLNVRGEGLVLVRYAARYERPLASHPGTFGLSIEGHPGRADRPAALELVVRAFEASDAPVLLVRLPASSAFDPAARQALQAAPGVRSVEDARDGALLVRLQPLASNEERRIPLRLRWLASGTRPGPSLAAWDDATPWNTSSAVGEPIDVE